MHMHVHTKNGLEAQENPERLQNGESLVFVLFNQKNNAVNYKKLVNHMMIYQITSIGIA